MTNRDEKLDKTIGGLAAMAMVIRDWREERPRATYMSLHAEMLDDWALICLDAVALLKKNEQEEKQE